MNAENTSGQGLGLTSVLVIIFTVLKLVGVIDWSWWWVFSPFWIPVGLLVLMFLAYILLKALIQ